MTNTSQQQSTSNSKRFSVSIKHEEPESSTLSDDFIISSLVNGGAQDDLPAIGGWYPGNEEIRKKRKLDESRQATSGLFSILALCSQSNSSDSNSRYRMEPGGSAAG